MANRGGLTVGDLSTVGHSPAEGRDRFNDNCCAEVDLPRRGSHVDDPTIDKASGECPVTRLVRKSAELSARMRWA
jgi:hypothetical protein